MSGKQLHEESKISTTNDPDLGRLLNLIDSGLSTNSGIYAGVDPSLSMRLNERGEYQYVGLDSDYDGPAGELLRLSAFAGIAPSEDDIARELYSRQENAQYDMIAGYYVGSFAGWAEPSFRSRGSSGGLATWVLSELMRRGEIDGVIHLKPGGSEGQLFSYQVSRNVAEIFDGAKTRYYPGELSSALREIRQNPGRYAVVGIPSFIYEVRLLQRIEPIFAERITYTIGLITGHQKTANYASYLGWRGGFAPGDLKSIDFRKKVDGEPANRYSTELTGLSSGVVQRKILAQEKLVGTDWGLGYFKSNFSDFTQDALNETADLVLGDAWLPKYSSDGRGTNVVIVRDQRLLPLLRAGQDTRTLHLEEIPIADILRSQTSLVKQSVLEVSYRFKYLSQRGELTPRLRREELIAPLSFGRRLIQRARLATSRESHMAFQAALHGNDLHIFDRRMEPLARRYRVARRFALLQRLSRKEPRAIIAALKRATLRSFRGSQK